MTKTMKKFFSTITMFAMIIAALSFTACSSGGDDGDDRGGSGNSGSSASTGSNNTTDFVVTGGVQEVGMTYVKVRGYVNGYNNPSELEFIQSYIYVDCGTSQNSLSRSQNIAIRVLDKRTVEIVVKRLKPNTKYYYRLRVDNESAKQVESFTTKAAAFNGQMTTGEPSDITFRHATISSNVNTSSLNSNETFWKGIAYSEKSSDLSAQLANKLYQSSFVPNSSVYEIQDGTSYNGHYQNGTLHFQVGDEVGSQTLTTDPGNTVYYCPFLIIGDNSFVGNVKQVTTRKLAVNSGYVDLGLSCKWAATNLEAKSPWDMGWSTSSKNTAASRTTSNSNGGRLPTISEAMELNNCRIESIDDGALITGPNGNQIFIPNPPIIEYGAQSLKSNCYWTSSQEYSSLLESYYTTYFCVSGNSIKSYKIEDFFYPGNDNCYVRPVK